MDLLQVVVSGVLVGGIYALVSVGLTLIFGVLDIVNFAHGSFLMIAMYVCYYCWSILGLDPLAAVPVCVAVLGLVGWLTYWGMIRRVMGRSALTQIICTFAILVALEGLAEVFFTANNRAIGNPFSQSLGFRVGGIAVSGPQLVGFVGALLITALLALFINRTELGTAIRAVGEDRAASAIMGINVRSMEALSWALGLGVTGAAGALLMNSYTVNPTAGETFGLIAFFALALGGFGSLVGAGLAGVALGVAQSVAALYAPQYALVALVGVFLIFVVARPQGILGSR